MEGRIRSEWKNVFAGRDKELREIVGVWESVKSGFGPKIHIVRGERGMGKTRLVQEFYKYLSENEDPESYWPDGLSFIGSDLQTGPDSSHDPIAKDHFESFSIAERTMPYLWWGFRLADFNKRNVTRSSLSEHTRTLDPHLQSAEYAKVRKALDKGLIELGKDKLKEGGVDLAVEFVADTIPMAPLALKLTRAGLKLRENRKSAQKLAEDFSKQTIQSFNDSSARNLNELTLKKVCAILKEQGSAPLVPVVIFVDDAQFASNELDIGTHKFLRDIWKLARDKKLPLFMIATHWDSDWLANKNLTDDSCFAASFSSQKDDIEPYITQTVLSKGVKLMEVVKAGVPNLSAADYELILNKADGNPYLLQELIELIHDSPAWLKQKELGLSESGRADIQSESLEIHKLIARRLTDKKRTPEDVRNAIVLGSALGINFSQLVVCKAGEKLGLKLTEDIFTRADEPHGYVNIETDATATFVQRATFEAANKLIKNYFGDSKKLDGIMVESAKELAQNSNLSITEKFNLSGIQIGFGSDSLNVTDRENSAMETVKLIEDIYYETSNRRDIAQAVSLIKEIEGLLKNEKYEYDWFTSVDFSLFGDVYDEWFGEGASLNHHSIACRMGEDFYADSSDPDDIFWLYEKQRKLAERFLFSNKYEEAFNLFQKCLENWVRLANIDSKKFPVETSWSIRLYIHEVMEELWGKDAESLDELWKILSRDVNNYTKRKQGERIDPIGANVFLKYSQYLSGIKSYAAATNAAREAKRLIEHARQTNPENLEGYFFIQLIIIKTLADCFNAVNESLAAEGEIGLIIDLIDKARDHQNFQTDIERFKEYCSSVVKEYSWSVKKLSSMIDPSSFQIAKKTDIKSPREREIEAETFYLESLKSEYDVATRLQLLEKSIEAYRALDAEGSLFVGKNDFARALLRLGMHKLLIKKRDLAILDFDEGFSILRLLQENSKESEDIFYDQLCRVGELWQIEGDFDKALQYFKEAVTVARQLTLDHPSSSNQRKYGDSLGALGDIKLLQGNPSGAFLDFNNALARARVLFKEDAILINQRYIMHYLSKCGQCLALVSKFKKSKIMLLEAKQLSKFDVPLAL